MTTNEEVHEFAKMVEQFGSVLYKALFTAMRNAMTSEEISIPDVSNMEIEFYNFGKKLATYID